MKQDQIRIIFNLFSKPPHIYSKKVNIIQFPVKELFYQQAYIKLSLPNIRPQ